MPGATNAARAKHISSDSADDPKDPTEIDWDGSQLARKPWYDALPARFSRINPAFRTWWEKGYTLGRGNIVNTTSTEHSYQMYKRNLRP